MSLDTSYYEIIVTDHRGNHIKVVKDFYSLDYARKVNDIGELSLVIEDKNTDFIFTPENRIEVWRIKGDLSMLDMNATWFITGITKTVEGTTRLLEIRAQDQMCLINRRIIPYNEGNPTTEKQAPGDNVIKAIMRENFGALASDTNRDLSAYLTIQSDTSQAPQVTIFCAKNNVFDTLKEIADASYVSNTFLSFDLIYNPDTGTFLFSTFINQRGSDRSIETGDGHAIIGLEYGSVSKITFIDERIDEKNYIYAGAKDLVGIVPDVEISDDQSIALSPFNRKELFLNASDADDVYELTDEGNSTLEKNRAIVRVIAEMSQEFIAEVYGDKINYGDKVTVSFNGRMYSMFANAVNVSIEKSGETITFSLLESNE